MSKPPPSPDPDCPPGVQEALAVYDDGLHAEAAAALEEYRLTGVSYSVDDAVTELDRLIAERRARQT